MRLRPGQSLVLQLLQRGKDTLAIFPTGYGKTLCYEIPVRDWGWRVLLISPLQSLILDQERRFSATGCRTIAYCRALMPKQLEEFENRFQLLDWDIAITSPEKLLRIWTSAESDFAKHLESINLIVLDEAHTLSQWNNFRRAFSSVLQRLRTIKNGPPLLLTSATCTRSDQRYLEQTLARRLSTVRLSPIARNIGIVLSLLHNEQHRKLTLCALLQKVSAQSLGIVYCRTRAESIHLSEFLCEYGIQAASFHAGLSKEKKNAAFQMFTKGEIKVICATSAFGLGIDNKNVRQVIHYGVPYSIAQYVQEIGRAGRDGGAATAIALVTLSDVEFHLNAITESKSDAELIDNIREVNKIWGFILSPICRRQNIDRYFNLRSTRKCGICDNCRPDLLLKNYPQLNYSTKLIEPWWAEKKFITQKYIQEQCWFRVRLRNCQEKSKSRNFSPK